MKRRLTVPKDEKGRFPMKHNAGLDPGLVGLKAFDHPAVKRYHEWLIGEYEPRYSVALVTPCSNVKPYPLSPTSRKVAGLLKRLGLWDAAGPSRLEWLYLSDLLVLVPYWRAWDYPACCYELHPEELTRSKRHYLMVVGLLARAMERLADTLEAVIVFLPRNHLRIWDDAKARARRWPREHRVKYTIFSTRELEEAIKEELGLKSDGGATSLDRFLRR